MTDVFSLGWPRFLVGVAAALSFATLAGAYYFEYVIGLAPCALCWWQRYAHFGFLAVCVPLAARVQRLTLILPGGLALISAGIAAFHSGVEREWWPGLASCSAISEDLGKLDGASMIAVEAAPAIVRCDEIPWTFMNLSMANYNVLISLAMAALVLAAARRAN